MSRFIFEILFVGIVLFGLIKAYQSPHFDAWLRRVLGAPQPLSPDEMAAEAERIRLEEAELQRQAIESLANMRTGYRRVSSVRKPRTQKATVTPTTPTE